MIARTSPTWQPPSWQNELAQAIRDPQVLLERLQLDHLGVEKVLAADQQFPLRVTESYLSRIQPGDPNDPLLLQILPQAQELLEVAGYGANPVGDQEATMLPGLLHKYQGRCLLITTAACAVHCRYCFRRHFPYQESRLDSESLQQAIDYIAADKSLEEVILSGGDPLSLSDQRLGSIFQQLAAIPHIKRLRIHSRQPVVLPSRITEELIQILREYPLQCVIVLHFNHANEFSDEVSQAISQLILSGATLLNQSVLLKGVNDSVEALHALSEQLFANRILPYYLHLLDKVAGAAHFDLSPEQAQQLISSLRSTLPGYLVPRLVQEQAGKAYKQPI